MRMWPQMVDQMFWSFAIKVSAERMNSLHIDTDGHTPESKFYGVNIENIPVKTFHTKFCSCYVLDSRFQSAGSIGPPKWEPRSNIRVYLGCWRGKTHCDRYVSKLWSTHVLGAKSNCAPRVSRVSHVLSEAGGEQKLVVWSWSDACFIA